MKTRLISVFLLSAAFPLAAMAQDSTPDTTTKQTQQLDQSGAAGTTSATSGASGETFVTVPATGAWRVSDLEGKSVYGTDGESIGDISDVLVSQDGSVNAVIIGVGGFLGIGEKDVAVNMSALQLGPGATQQEANQAGENSGISDETTASTQSGTATGGAGTDATRENVTGMDNDTDGMVEDDEMAANTSDVEIGEDGLPDRIILSVTREQLEDAPAFEGVTAERRE